MWDGLHQAKQGKIPEKAAELWGADPASLKFVSMDHDVIFRIKTAGKTRYLRITHPLIRSQQELTAAIHFQRYLFATGAPICEPIASLNGHDVEKIRQGKTVWLAYVNEELQGEAIHFEQADKNIYEAWGRSLAHLHRVAKSYHPDNHQFLYWHDVWEEAGRLAENEDAMIRYEYKAIDDWLSNIDKNQHEFGLIHGNHQRGRVFYDGETVRLLDMHEPVFHWFFADLTRPFLHLSPQRFAQMKEKARWFLDGYSVIQPLAEEKIAYLPWFVRMQNLEQYLWKKNLAVVSGFENVDLAAMLEEIREPVRSWEL